MRSAYVSRAAHNAEVARHIRAAAASATEAAELRAVLRRLAMAAEAVRASDSGSEPWGELCEALDHALGALGLSTCAHCGRPCDAEADLCDRPECLASVPEVQP